MTLVGTIFRNLLGRRDESGAALVEFAIALPVVIFVFLGVINLGAYAWQATRVTDALEAGVFFVMKKGWSTANSPGDINTAVANAHADVGGTAPAVTGSATCNYGCPNAGAVVASVACNAAPPANCSALTGGLNTDPPGRYVNITVSAPWAPLVADPYVGTLPNPITATATVRYK